MSLIITSVAFLVGGLGLFLLGMKFMSDGLQTVAGPSLQRLVGAVTNNRLLGVAVGFGVTGLIQSSSITTVMTIGFVNAEMMTLKQALGVIMGANIGTTITGWLLVLNIGKYGIPLAGIFAIIYAFVKNERIRYTAFAILGVGLVFMGLEAMKDALTPFADSPDFKGMFALFEASSKLGVLKCVFIGCLTTAIIQSSSATIGIIIALATEGLVSFETSAALVLGSNIGSTITAFLASIGTSRAARRAALFHIIFNVVGVIWVVLLFDPYFRLIKYILEVVFGITNPEMVRMVDGVETRPYIMSAIATYHTAFNVVNVILFLPLTSFFANFLEHFFRKKKMHHMVATRLEAPLLASPFAAITQSDREIVAMGECVASMMTDLKFCMFDDRNPDIRKKRDAIFAGEEHLDLAQEEITNFLTELLSKRSSQSIANDAERQLRMCDDLETASDYITQLLKLNLRMHDHHVEFDKDHQNGLLHLHQQIDDLIIAPVLTLFSRPGNKEDLVAEIHKNGAAVTQKVRELRSLHWSQLAEAQYDPLVSTSYTDMLSSYRKVKEHMLEVADSYEGTK